MIVADCWFFDIDGTLLVTRDLVHWNGLHRAMLEVYGVDTTIEGLPYHGKTDIAILRAALTRCGVPSERFQAGLRQAIAAIREEVSAKAHEFVIEICAGIPAFLSQIRHESQLLGIASGNLELVGWSKIEAAGLREFFSAGSFGDQCEMRSQIFDHAVSLAKAALGSTATVCFVGDTPDDIRAARTVNAQILAVSSGTFSFDELSRLNPDACCRSCCELLEPSRHVVPLSH